MNPDTMAALLREWKENTGLDYFLQDENGNTVVSTCPAKGKFLRDLASSALTEAAVEQGIRQWGLDFSAGRYLLMTECTDLNAGLLEEAAAATFENALEEESCVVDGRGRYLLLLDSSAWPEPGEAARLLQGTLEGETMSRVRIGISSRFTQVRALPDACREAETALDALRMFSLSERVSSYNELGIRLAAMRMPRESAEEYLQGVLGNSVEAVLADDELLRTAEVFLQTGLNSAETARLLIVHRNTLNYRLDKIQKLCGLDLKRFEDAAAFRLASLIGQRLRQEKKKSREGQ